MPSGRNRQRRKRDVKGVEIFFGSAAGGTNVAAKRCNVFLSTNLISNADHEVDGRCSLPLYISHFVEEKRQRNRGITRVTTALIISGRKKRTREMNESTTTNHEHISMDPLYIAVCSLDYTCMDLVDVLHVRGDESVTGGYSEIADVGTTCRRHDTSLRPHNCFILFSGNPLSGDGTRAQLDCRVVNELGHGCAISATTTEPCHTCV